MRVDEEWHIKFHLSLELPSVIDITQADDDGLYAKGFDAWLETAQLRDLFASKNSAVVAQESENCTPVKPQAFQLGNMAIGVGKLNAPQRIDRIGHHCLIHRAPQA